MNKAQLLTNQNQGLEWTNLWIMIKLKFWSLMHVNLLGDPQNKI